MPIEEVSITKLWGKIIKPFSSSRTQVRYRHCSIRVVGHHHKRRPVFSPETPPNFPSPRFLLCQNKLLGESVCVCVFEYFCLWMGSILHCGYFGTNTLSSTVTFSNAFIFKLTTVEEFANPIIHLMAVTVKDLSLCPNLSLYTYLFIYTHRCTHRSFVANILFTKPV